MKKNYFFTGFFVVMVTMTFAQQTTISYQNIEPIAFAESGTCYTAKVHPAQYKLVTDTVLLARLNPALKRYCTPQQQRYLLTLPVLNDANINISTHLAVSQKQSSDSLSNPTLSNENNSLSTDLKIWVDRSQQLSKCLGEGVFVQMCLVEIPAEYEININESNSSNEPYQLASTYTNLNYEENIIFIPNQSLTDQQLKNATWTVIEHYVLEVPEQLDGWSSMITCCTDGDKDILVKIEKALYERGYYSNRITNTMNTELKSALVLFQKDHQLPVGNLDKETLDFLLLDKH